LKYQFNYLSYSEHCSLVRDASSENFVKHLEFAKSILYSCRTSYWASCNASFPSSPAIEALRSGLDYDFVNHLGVTIIHSRIASWPNADHWMTIYIISEASHSDPRRMSLLEHILGLFINEAISQVIALRQKHSRPPMNDYNRSSQATDDKDWNDCCALEISCTATLLRAINLCEVLALPFDHYLYHWQNITQNPMFLH
jgi:hypothetical protein